MDWRKVSPSNFRWVLLFSHPKDYTPVCTTEMAEFSKRRGEFDDLGVKLLGFSMDLVQDHHGWAKDICHMAGTSELGYPILEGSKELVEKLGMKEVEQPFEGPIFTARTVIY